MSDHALTQERPDGHRPRSITLAWLAYTAFIVYGSLIPFHFVFDLGLVAEKLAEVPLNPLLTQAGRHVSLTDVAQNLLFFVPFGAIGVVAMSGRRSRPAVALRVVGLASLFSVTVEAMQLFTADRATALTDVLTDTAGAALGGVAAFVVLAGRERMAASVSWAARDRRAAFAVTCAIALACLAAWTPFDPTFDVSTMVAKIHALQRDAWQVGGWMRQGGTQDGVRGLLLGAAVANWLPVAGPMKRAIAATLLTLTIVVVLALTAVFLTSRQPGLAEWSVTSGGALAGVLVGIWRRPIGARLWSGLAVGGALAGLMLDDVLTSAGRLHSTAHSHDGDAMVAIAVMMMVALTFAPFGFAAARMMPSRAFALAAAIVAVVLLSAVAGAPRLALAAWATPAAAAAGALGGAWTAASGQRRFDAALALADSR